MPEITPQEKAKPLETVDLNGVEIFSEGKWNGDDYSGDDLQAMIDAFPQVGFQPVVKAGHADGQEDEKKARQVFDAPALGYVSKIYRDGKKLLADLIQVPKRFADLIKTGAYKRISSEIYWGYNDEANGKKFPRALKAVAFLGDRIPALTNLKEIEALYEKGDGGKLYAYDDKGNEFRAYHMDCAMPMNPGMSMADYLVNYPRKSKEAAGYTEGSKDERCGACKFYLGYPQACVLVEGRIEPEYVCDYFEGRAEMKMMGRNGDGEVKQYTIEKRGDEWCLIAGSGKTLGCHPSKEKAEAQERAVQASKHSKNGDGIWITLEEMRGICPPCAQKMEHRNFSKIKIADENGSLTRDYRVGEGTDINPATVEALCPKFDPEEGFRTRCMAWAEEKEIRDPGGFCNDLKRECYSAAQQSKEYAMEIMEKDGQHCVMDGEKTVKCYPTKAEAEEHVKKMSKGGPDMDEKKFEELKAQVKADAEAREVAIKKNYDDQMATLKAEGDKREKEQGEKIKTLERQRFDDQNKQWIKDQKAAGHLAPVEEPRILAIFSELFQDARIVKFSQDGKDATETLMQAVKSFVENRPTIFAELSRPGDDLPAESDNVGDEVNRKTVEWMNKNSVKDYGQAMKAVLAQKENAELALSYLRMQKQ